MAGFVSKGTCTWCCLRQLRDKQISAPACQSLQRLLQWPCLGVVIYPAQMVSATSYSPEALFLQQLLCGNGVDRMESPWESTSSHILSMASLNRSSSLVTESLHPYTNLPVAADNHFFFKGFYSRLYQAGFAFLWLISHTYYAPGSTLLQATWFLYF